MSKSSKRPCHCHPREIHHCQDAIPSAAKPGKSAALKYVSKRADLNSRQPRAKVTVRRVDPATLPKLTDAQIRSRGFDRHYSAVLLGTR